jgi:hypothetical protein
VGEKMLFNERPRLGTRAESRLSVLKDRLDERAQQRARPQVEAAKSSVGRADYGGQLTGLDFSDPRSRRRFLKIAAPAVVIALTFTFLTREAARTDSSYASELGPTPKVLPAPEETTREMAEFERTIIKAINQEPHVAAIATPTASEIQQQKPVVSEKSEKQGQSVKLEILNNLNLEEYHNPVLLKTAMESNRGIESLSKIIMENLNSPEMTLDGVSEEEIIFVLAWDRQDIHWGMRIGDHMVLNAIAYGEKLEEKDEEGFPLISVNSIDQIHRARLISVIIHEEIHQKHWFGGYLYSDEVLYKVQDDLVNYLVHLATRIYAAEEEGWEWPTESGISPDAEKGIQLIEELDAVGAEGYREVLKAAVTGDIASLEKYYDSFCGDGAFRQINWVSRYVK